MAKRTWTPEPWEIEKAPGTAYPKIIGPNGEKAMETVGIPKFTKGTSGNADRIIECVNAMAADGVVAELVAAAEKVVEKAEKKAGTPIGIGDKEYRLFSAAFAVRALLLEDGGE